MARNKKRALFLASLLLMAAIIVVPAAKTQAAAISPVLSTNFNLNIDIGGDEGNPGQTASALQILFLLSIIALAPSILLMMTSFPRFLVSLHFLRSALGTQQMPPNQILISLAIFLSIFLMRNQITEINDKALKPYSAGEITQQEAIDNAIKPLREFMLTQVAQGDIDLFANMADTPYSIHDADTIPNTVLIPAFMIGELTKAFTIGVLIFVPFIVIDMVVASTLMAMGMMMLPPAMISLPFKILLFVLVDGWNLTLGRVFESFLRR